MSGPAPDFPRLLARFGHLVQSVLEGETPESFALDPRRRLLPLTAALLNGRRTLEPSGVDVGKALTQFGIVGLHLAFLAEPRGEPNQRLRSLLRLQRRRHDAFRGDKPDWWEASPRHCFDRALANAVSVAYEIDGRGDPDRVATQAADCANYLIFFLARSGARLEVVEVQGEQGGRAA